MSRSTILVLSFMAQTAFAIEFERVIMPFTQGIWGVAAADVNGDNQLDILAAADTQAVAYLAPDWKLVMLHEMVAGKLLHATVADCDRDGDLDFVIARSQSPWVDFRKGQAEGKTAPHPPGPDFTLAWIENTGRIGDELPLHVLETDFSNIHGVCVGDVNGDGLADLVAGSFGGPEADSIALLLAKRDAPGFASKRITRGGAKGRAHYLDIADVNADGRSDVLLGASAAGEATAWLQNTDTTWTPRLIASEPGATHAQATDMDSDGVQDIVVSNGHGNGIHWFKGPQWQKHIADADISDAHAMAVADLDGDGDRDVVAGSFGQKITLWLENDGHGRFTRHIIDEGNNQESYDLKVADLNRDGRPDLLLAGRRSNNVVLYRQIAGR